MKKHPDKKHLIDIIIGHTDGMNSEVLTHIKECKECTAIMESLRLIIHESDNSSIVPSEHIKNGLFMKDDNAYLKSGYTASGPKNLFRPSYAAAAAAIVIAVFVTALFLTKEQLPINTALRLTPLHGSITYNDVAMNQNTEKIFSGEIKTGDKSAADIEIESAFSVKIAEETDLTLLEAKEISENDNKKYSISLNMKSGIIMVSSNHNLIKKYTITTSQGIFTPIGTDFILSSGGSASRITVLEGTVQIIQADKITLLINKGEGCEIIEGRIKKININIKNEIDVFNKKYYNSETVKNLSHEKMPDNKLPADSSNNNKEQQIIKQETDNSEDKEKSAKELKNNKTELRNDSREIQNEMRRNRRGGKN